MKIQRIVKLMVATVVCGALVACGPGAVEDKTEYDGTEGEGLDEVDPEVAAMTDAAPPAIDFDDPDQRSINDKGEKASDLELLNDALEAAIQKNAAPGAITGKTMEEQMNSTAPKEAMTITSVDDLVKMGIIKAVPPAPDGKTYSIKAGKVVLE